MEILYIPFEYLMRICLYISGNHYFFALFFFALIMQIVLLPLGIKQHKNQVMQRKLRPKELAIRKKYAGRTDRATQQKMQLEIQDMHKSEGFNQFAGCLPMLIQLPIILILFTIVRQPISYSSNDAQLKADLKSGLLYKDAIEIVEQYKNEENVVKNEGQNYVGYKESLNRLLKDLGAVDTDKSDDAERFEFDASQRTNELVLTKIISEDRQFFSDLAQKHNLSLREDEVYPKSFSDEQRAALPNFGFFGESLLDTPSFSDITGLNFNLLLLIPFIIFGTSYAGGVINRKYMGSPTGADGNPMAGGKFMEWGMPLLSFVFSFSFPAAVGIYWIWRTITGAVQPIVLNQFYPMPVITEQEIAAAEKDIKKKKKKKVIMIEVDEDDDTYRDLEVKGKPVSSGKKPVSDNTGKKKNLIINNVEMLSADDDEDEDDEEGAEE